MSGETILFKDKSFRIIGACLEVYNNKGAGFLEGVYQDCLEIELTHLKIPFLSQVPVELSYRGIVIKHQYVPDLICFTDIIVELKAVNKLADEHRAQVHNYLKATGKKLGLLVNFGCHSRLEWERIIKT